MAVLVISMHNEPYYVERAIRAGAWGYLTKHEASDKVLTAIRKVLEGEVYLSVPLSPILLRRFLTGSPGADDAGISSLSDRELQVFQMIGAGKGVH